MKKKSILLAIFTAVVFSSCEKEPDPILISSIELETTSNTIYADGVLPTLTLTIDPNNADDPSIKWSSSNESLITVDSLGALTLVAFEYGKSVTITAKNEASSKSATCELSLAVKKANIDDYGIINIKGYKFNNPYNRDEQFEIKFDILDRNLGATALNGVGDYYQFGNDIPVATEDACGSNFDKEYNSPKLDWSVAENTPCPEGWRMITDKEMSILADAVHIADYYFSDQSIEDEDAAYAMEDKLCIAKSGYYTIEGNTAEERAANSPILKYGKSAKVFWSGAIAVDKNSENILSNRDFIQAKSFEYNYLSINAKGEINSARPIRCVK